MPSSRPPSVESNVHIPSAPHCFPFPSISLIFFPAPLRHAISTISTLRSLRSYTSSLGIEFSLPLSTLILPVAGAYARGQLRQERTLHRQNRSPSRPCYHAQISAQANYTHIQGASHMALVHVWVPHPVYRDGSYTSPRQFIVP